MSNHTPFIGLVVLGYWGKSLLRKLFKLWALHAAYNANSTTLSEYEKKYPAVNFTKSFDNLLSNTKVKAVAISAPAATHYELVTQSLLNGKDVFVEKPLAMMVREGGELVKLANSGSRILMVGHIQQYHSAIIKLKKLISEGEFGKLQYMYSNRLNIGKLLMENNILWSFAPHDISVIMVLLAEGAVRVSVS